MSEEIVKILEMLKEGLITIEEAESLIKAVGKSQEEGKSEKKWPPDFHKFTDEIEHAVESMQVGKFLDNVASKIKTSVSAGFNTVAGTYIDESVDASGIEELKLEHSGGSLTVHKIDGQEFSIKCIRRTFKIEEGVLTVNSIGGNLSVGVPNIVKKVKAVVSGGNATINNIEVGKLKVETTGGNLSISDVSGSVRASAMGGNIDMSNINSINIQAKSIGGKIQLILGTLTEGEVGMDSTGGGIKLFVSEDSAFDLDAEIVGGKFETDLDWEMIEDGPMQHKAKYNDGEASVSIKVKHGDVEIAKR